MVEMLGSLEPLSRQLLPPHLRHAPTRIEVTIYIFTSKYLSTYLHLDIYLHDARWGPGCGHVSPPTLVSTPGAGTGQATSTTSR